MANNVNIFDKYGIKEVANVYFIALETDKKAGVYAGDIVLYLDSLKVSTIETTAEEAYAEGGWGNPRLVSWNYGKEITVTLTDALMSLESLRFMLGGSIKKKGTETDPIIVHHSEEVTCITGGVVPLPKDHLTGETYGTITPSTAHPIRLINLTKGTRTQLVAAADALDGTKAILFSNPALIGDTDQKTDEGDRIRITWETELKGAQNETETAVEVTISPNTFPGQYKIVGDTFMRSQSTGADEPFQFIINNAKVSSDVTITLEAEGDPSTFDMTLNVLRDKTGSEMMKLVRYSLGSESAADNEDDVGSVVAGGSGGNG